MAKCVYFNGIKFTKDDKTGYYLNSTIRKRLHRYVWEFYNGTIEKGYDIHHKDGNKENNDISNLVKLLKSKHLHYHNTNQTEEVINKKRKNIKEKALPEAIKWHKSEEGRKWHSKHSLEISKNLKEKEYTCLNCDKHFYKKPYGVNKFCSNKCKTAYRRKKGLDNVEKICERCGGVFVDDKYNKRKYCSRECSKGVKSNKN